MFQIVSFYRFIPVTEQQIQAFREAANELSETTGLAGLVITAPEGFNGTVASEKIEAFTDLLEGMFPGGDWRYKRSTAERNPFKRLSIKVRKEIVTSGRTELVPDGIARSDSHLSPEEWHEVLSSDEDYVLIDVRNHYEVKLGTFRGAVDPFTAEFTEFPKYVQESGIPKDKRVLMFCTGGIRCEKAYLEMKEEGYTNVQQLDGGILTYLEKYPEGHFSGECFVFDERVAVDTSLAPSKVYTLCPHCGDPAADLLSCELCGKDAKVCAGCRERHDRRSCSKNCAYHLRVQAGEEPHGRSRNVAGAGGKRSTKKGHQVVCAAAISFLLWLSTCFVPQHSLAEATAAKPQKGGPESVVQEALAKMKQEGNPSPIVDYVEWSDSFRELDAARREAMGVSSADELREFYRGVLSSPAEELIKLYRSKYQDRLEKLNNSEAEKLFASLKDRAEQKEEEMRRKIKEATFVIMGSSVTGDTASVSVQQSFAGESKHDDLKLVKKDGQWYFASLPTQGMK